MALSPGSPAPFRLPRSTGPSAVKIDHRSMTHIGGFLAGFALTFAVSATESFRRTFEASYFLAGGAGRAGWANVAASIGTFACTELSSVTDRPSVHVVVHLKAILIPETSR